MALPRRIVLLLLVAVSTRAAAQAPVIVWERTVGSTQNDNSSQLLPMADGGVTVACMAAGSDGEVVGSNGGADAWLVRLDAGGGWVDQHCYGGTGNEAARSLVAMPDSGQAFCGWATTNSGDVSGNHGGNDGWVVRRSAAGELMWQLCLGGTYIDQLHSISLANDGSLLVSGSVGSSDGDVQGNHGEFDVRVVRVSADGEMVWQRCYGGTDDDQCVYLLPLPDGGFVFVGNTHSYNGDVAGYHGGGDAWVVRADVNGDILWQRAVGGSLGDHFNHIASLGDDGFVLAGVTSSNNGDVSGNNGFDDAWLVWLSAEGDLLGQHCYGGSTGDVFTSLLVLPDGVLAGGYTSSSDGDVVGHHGGQDAWLVRTNTQGALAWQHCYGGANHDLVQDLAWGLDGGLYFCGETLSIDGDVAANNGGKDAWVVRLDATVNIAETTPAALQLAPNPVDEALQLSWNTAAASVLVLDVQGRVLQRTAVPAAVRSCALPMEGLTSGIYFVALMSAEGARTIGQFVKR